jgi:hypothetical protein
MALGSKRVNNTDVNGYSDMGVSPYATLDMRLPCRIDKQWRAAFGIDRSTTARYWNFHTYPQRSYVVEVKSDPLDRPWRSRVAARCRSVRSVLSGLKLGSPLTSVRRPWRRGSPFRRRKACGLATAPRE